MLATSLSVILALILSSLFFVTELTLRVSVGAVLVAGSVSLFGLYVSMIIQEVLDCCFFFFFRRTLADKSSASVRSSLVNWKPLVRVPANALLHCTVRKTYFITISCWLLIAIL